ncbi:MAG: CotH kinase family protein, partial [Oscillospiraceae bacterium]|nr:CotH kinase family protein [Oscillospiraceae bacterium]
DFNNACDNYAQEPADVSGFTILYAPWFERLIKDQRFVDEVTKQYKKLRKTTLSDEYLQAYITDTINYLGPEIEDNYEVWGDVWTTEGKNAYVLANSYLQPLDRNYTSYDEAVTQLRTYITLRGKWLDENIDNLNQYCHDSRTVNETLQ